MACVQKKYQKVCFSLAFYGYQKWKQSYGFLYLASVPTVVDDYFECSVWNCYLQWSIATLKKLYATAL